MIAALAALRLERSLHRRRRRHFDEHHVDTYAAGSGPGIVNLLTITGEEQVALKVTIAEVQRSVTKQLGINLNGGSSTGEDFEYWQPPSAAALRAALSPLPGRLGEERRRDRHGASRAATSRSRRRCGRSTRRA